MIDRSIGDKERLLKGSSNLSVLIMDNYGWGCPQIVDT